MRFVTRQKATLLVIQQAEELLPSNDAMPYWLQVGSQYSAAYANREMIGLAVLYTDIYANACEIGVYVAPPYRRRGVGALLASNLLVKLPRHCNGSVLHAPGAEAFFDPLLRHYKLSGHEAPWLSDVKPFEE